MLFHVVNFTTCTVKINRQLNYHNGELRLCPVKTLKGVREIPMTQELYEELEFLEAFQDTMKEKYGMAYKNTERVYDEIERKWIVGGDFVNRKANGELLTTNSMKYWTKKIKAELGIDYKYHNLRHTFATRCAEKNVNMYLLMDMMGHKKIDTTKKYYLRTDGESLLETTKKIISTMYDDDDGWKKYMSDFD